MEIGKFSKHFTCAQKNTLPNTALAETIQLNDVNELLSRADLAKNV